MKNSFYGKAGLIFALIIALLIPRSYLSDLIYERIGWRDQAYQSIRQSWPGEQTIAGPVLAVTYQISHQVKEKIFDPAVAAGVVKPNAKTARVKPKPKEIVKTVSFDGILYLIPQKLSVDSKLDSSLRYRGIYGVPIYTNDLQVNGEFDLQPLRDVIELYKDKTVTWRKPQLTVLVSDQRGIVAPPVLQLGGTGIDFTPGSSLPGTELGMSAVLPEPSPSEHKTLPFAFNMQLKGMGAAKFALLSDDTVIKLSSNWANPSFSGEMLPDKRAITGQGFTAEWHASSFSFNVNKALEDCRNGNCMALLNKSVGFDLIQPVDVYQQSERSIKYAFLFITFTFLMLILLELLKKLRIHPIQYTLVGMALLVFYLLLISLAEHIAFIWAYASGAAACTALLTFYFGAILHSNKLGAMLGAALATVYAVLYVILQAQDTALLMGSLLLFGLLAFLMLSTRKLDWYALTRIDNQPETPQSV